MKVKVLIPFCDKNTGKKYKKADIIDITVMRFNEITTKGRYVEPIEETKQTKA